MATSKPDQAQAKPESADAAEASAVATELTLTEFCTRLSGEIRRPELIGGYFATETAAGTVKATEADFRQRFDAFCKKPV